MHALIRSERAVVTVGISKTARLLALAALLGGCQAEQSSGGQPQAMNRLTGTVLYRERIALPADATIEVRLEDVSRADAPADVIAAQTIAPGGRQVPIPFEVAYAPERIEPNRRYGLRAAIRSASGDLMFTTTAHHAVLEQGAALSGIELLVQRVGSSGAGGAPSAGAAGSPQSTGSITGASWRLVSITRAGGAVERVPSEPAYTIEFGADGRYSGQAHCNRYMGGYERPAADRIAIRGGASTLAACPPPSIADEFLRTLAGATRYVVRNDELELAADDGRSLTFARAAPQAAAPEVGRTFVYDCDGDVSFTVRTGPGELALWAPESLGGAYTVLAASPPGSPQRYQESDSVVVIDGDSATFEIGGQRFADCMSNPAKVPWADAKRRGATFRALGNEPAWNLEIFPDRVAMVTNLGEDRTELAHDGPAVDGTRTTYRATRDGRELTVVIERQPCTDTMSGEAFEAAATVTFGEETFRGCGRFL
jgi:putative lipoprotein